MDQIMISEALTVNLYIVVSIVIFSFTNVLLSWSIPRDGISRLEYTLVMTNLSVGTSILGMELQSIRMINNELYVILISFTILATIFSSTSYSIIREGQGVMSKIKGVRIAILIIIFCAIFGCGVIWSYLLSAVA